MATPQDLFENSLSFVVPSRIDLAVNPSEENDAITTLETSHPLITGLTLHFDPDC